MKRFFFHILVIGDSGVRVEPRAALADVAREPRNGALPLPHSLVHDLKRDVDEQRDRLLLASGRGGGAAARSPARERGEGRDPGNGFRERAKAHLGAIAFASAAENPGAPQEARKGASPLGVLIFNHGRLDHVSTIRLEEFMGKEKNSYARVVDLVFGGEGGHNDGEGAERCLALEKQGSVHKTVQHRSFPGIKGVQ